MSASDNNGSIEKVVGQTKRVVAFVCPTTLASEPVVPVLFLVFKNQRRQSGRRCIRDNLDMCLLMVYLANNSE